MLWCNPEEGASYTVHLERMPSALRLGEPIGDDPEGSGVEAEPAVAAEHLHALASG